MKKLALISWLLLVGGCSSTTSLNGMYLKQNYLQIIQYANQYDSLDDYGVWKVCQSLARAELFDDFYVCEAELKARVYSQNDLIADSFTPSMKTAMFEAMEAEVELGLGRYQNAVDLSERVIQRMEAEPYSMLLISDTGQLAYEATKVLLRAEAAIGDRERMLAAIEKAKRLALYRYVGDEKKRFQAIKFRIIQDFKLSPILTEAYYAVGDYEQALVYSADSIEQLENVGLLQSTLFSTLTLVETTLSGARTAEGKIQTFADTMFANKLLPGIIKARSELELGDFEAAKVDFDLVLSTQLITGMPRLYYPVLHDRGRVAEALGEHDDAVGYYRRSVEVIEASRKSIQDDAAKISYVGNKQEVFESLVGILYRSGDIAGAFEVAENAKSRALVDLLAGKGSIMPFTPDAKASAAAASLDVVETAIAKRDLSERAASRGIDIQEYQAAAQVLRNTAPEYASLVTSEPTKLHRVQQLLGQGEVLIEYYKLGQSLLIFAVSNSSIRAYSVEAPRLSFLVGEFRKSLSDVRSNRYEDVGAELYDLLISPAAGDIASASGLTIVPHGALHYIPFAALYSGKRFLIDEKPTRVLPSASVLQFLGKRHRDDASLLVLGNPDLNDASLDLPGAEREAIAIVEATRQQEISPTTRLLLRNQATETAIKRTGGQFQYIHLASHGVFNDVNPLSSRLLLVEDAENDGDLMVSELYGLKLNADLVTLSACETALGDVANGDDVVGFSRGFLYAGADSIVSSLWEVDDQATNELMQSFYLNLQSMNKRAALTDAMRTTKRTYQHPYYWAAFQLTGSI